MSENLVGRKSIFGSNKLLGETISVKINSLGFSPHFHCSATAHSRQEQARPTKISGDTLTLQREFSVTWQRGRTLPAVFESHGPRTAGRQQGGSVMVFLTEHSMKCHILFHVPAWHYPPTNHQPNCYDPPPKNKNMSITIYY